MSSQGAPQKPRLLRYGALIAVAFAVAAVFGWTAGSVSQPAAGKFAEAGWALPKPKSTDDTRDLEALKARRPWGGTATLAAQRGPKPLISAAPKWRVAGIVERGGERYVLISSASKPPKLDYLKIGDTLPDGSALVEITADGAVTNGGKGAEGEKHYYWLFGHKQQP